MTTIESIQMNIHDTRLNLAKSCRVVSTNEIEKMHIEATIEHYQKELKDLNICLNSTIKQN